MINRKSSIVYCRFVPVAVILTVKIVTSKQKLKGLVAVPRASRRSCNLSGGLKAHRREISLYEWLSSRSLCFVEVPDADDALWMNVVLAQGLV